LLGRDVGIVRGPQALQDFHPLWDVKQQ
jgi:hypothetical protein